MTFGWYYYYPSFSYHGSIKSGPLERLRGAELLLLLLLFWNALPDQQAVHTRVDNAPPNPPLSYTYYIGAQTSSGAMASSWWLGSGAPAAGAGAGAGSGCGEGAGAALAAASSARMRFSCFTITDFSLRISSTRSDSCFSCGRTGCFEFLRS